MKKNKKRTLIGNMLFNRYLKSTKYVRNSHSKEALAKFKTTLGFFRKYAAEYDFDQLALAAVSYQESTLDQSKRSAAGAVGVGSETVKYVSNIFKYYIAYELYAEDVRLEEQAND